VAEKLAVAETCTDAEGGFTATEMGRGAAVSVIVDDADLVESAMEVALSVMVAGFGTVVGALYVTEVVVTLVSVPHVAPEHPLPESDQVTPLFCESFCSVAEKLAVVETCTEAEGGFSVTEMAGAAVTVIVDEPDFVVSATEVAVRVTDAGLGRVAGAL